VTVKTTRRRVSTPSGVALGLVATIAGCFGGQTGQEDRAMRPVDCAIERTPLSLDTATPLGFSAADVETTLAVPARSSIKWSRMNTVSELSLTLIEVRARYLNESSNGACADTLGLDAVFAVETADGLLDERVDAVVEADAVDQAKVTAELAPDDVDGALTAELLDLDLRIWRDPKFAFHLWLGADPRLHGRISLDGGDPDRGDDAVPVSAAIAELPAP
jgi:hypothetical protein